MRNKVLSSACITTDKLYVPLPHCIPSGCRSNVKSYEFKARVNRIILIVKPCRIESRTGKGQERKPFTCFEDGAPSYMAFITLSRSKRYPWASSKRQRYWCEFPLKTASDSKDRVQKGCVLNCACAVASRTTAIASEMILPGTPQYWPTASPPRELRRTIR
jgi:hypothetical protein